MRAFVLAVLGWVFILYGWGRSSDSVWAGAALANFFFLASFISIILGMGRRQQRWWNIATLILLLPIIAALLMLVVGGITLGS